MRDSNSLEICGTRTDDHLHMSERARDGLPGSGDVPLPVGSCWFQKGGERHVTKCISSNECIFFINQNET